VTLVAPCRTRCTDLHQVDTTLTTAFHVYANSHAAGTPSYWVVTANAITLRYLKKRLDQYWQHQNFRAQIEGTGSRSEVSRLTIV